MEIWKALQGGVQSALETVNKKRKQIVDVQKVKQDIRKEEQRKQTALYALAKYYYEHARDKQIPELERYCVAIDQSQEKIRLAEEKLDALLYPVHSTVEEGITQVQTPKAPEGEVVHPVNLTTPAAVEIKKENYTVLFEEEDEEELCQHKLATAKRLGAPVVAFTDWKHRAAVGTSPVGSVPAAVEAAPVAPVVTTPFTKEEQAAEAVSALSYFDEEDAEDMAQMKSQLHERLGKAEPKMVDWNRHAPCGCTCKEETAKARPVVDKKLPVAVDDYLSLFEEEDAEDMEQSKLRVKKN